jgi:hypothetical protein
LTYLKGSGFTQNTFVIPAQAGIYGVIRNDRRIEATLWIPAYAGITKREIYVSPEGVSK